MRLRRDHVDILLGHGMRTLQSFDRFMTDGCYDAMVKLREQGKVRFIGISELSEGDGTHEVLQRAAPSGAFDVVMLTINLMLQTAPSLVPRPGHPEYWGTIAYDYHWHVELMPRLTKTAGFEWATGFYINPVSPELAKQHLRREVSEAAATA